MDNIRSFSAIFTTETLFFFTFLFTFVHKYELQGAALFSYLETISFRNGALKRNSTMESHNCLKENMYIINGAQDTICGMGYIIIRYFGNVEGHFYIILCFITLGIINKLLNVFAKSLGCFHIVVCAFYVTTRQNKDAFSGFSTVQGSIRHIYA